MATRKAFQHSASWASVWRMTSSWARRPMTGISDGRIWWLDLLIFLWKVRNRCIRLIDTHTHRVCKYLYSTSYQHCYKWHTDRVCQHIPQMKAKSGIGWRREGEKNDYTCWTNKQYSTYSHGIKVLKNPLWSRSTSTQQHCGHCYVTKRGTWVKKSWIISLSSSVLQYDTVKQIKTLSTVKNHWLLY